MKPIEGDEAEVGVLRVRATGDFGVTTFVLRPSSNGIGIAIYEGNGLDCECMLGAEETEAVFDWLSSWKSKFRTQGRPENAPPDEKSRDCGL